MRAVIQRVRRASVSVEALGMEEKIGAGFVVLLGVGADDCETDAQYIARKTSGLRVFEDSQGKMNLSLTDIGAEVLLISQFTLYGDCRKGRRPSFTGAAEPGEAQRLYARTAELIREGGIAVKTGRFREHMTVHIVNDGPVTVMLDSKKSF